MAGSNAYPFKKLKEYQDQPHPGNLPIKSYPITRGEMSSNAQLMDPPFKAPSKKAADPKIKHGIFDKLSQIKAESPKAFEEYIISHTNYSDLTRLLCVKMRQIEDEGPYSDQLAKLNKNRRFWETSASSMDKLLNEGTVGQYEAMYQVLPTLRELTHSEGFKMFVVAGLGNSLKYFRPGMLNMNLKERKEAAEQSEYSAVRVALNSNIASHVAFKVEPVLVDDVEMDERFPEGALSDERDIISVMCVPILLCNGEVLAVVEFYRKKVNFPYTKRMLDHVMNILEWVSSTIYRSKTAGGIEKLSEMSRFLMNTTENFLDKSTDADGLIKIIMKYAKNTIQGDRCSFFIYHPQTRELSASLFDIGNDASGNPIFERKNEIRFSIDRGIAGYVATNRVVQNVQDPYSDPRFNKDVDKRTGYLTKGILCAPIICDGKLYGVLQVINKVGGSFFSATDQKGFEMFTVYCSLAIRFMKMNIELVEKDAKLDIVKEQFALRTKIKQKHIEAINSKIPKKITKKLPSDFDSFYFTLECSDADDLIIYFLHMVKSTVEERYLPPDNVITTYALKCRNTYRDLTYHNFFHAMSFTHCMYLIIKKHGHFFYEYEALCYLIASLGHDLDHRGYSGDFLFQTKDPIGLLYGKESPLEQHHYDCTVSILSQPDSNMLVKVREKDLKDAKAFIEDAILSTDLALFMGNNTKLLALLNTSPYDHVNEHHKNLMRRVMMPACDLAMMVKSFDFVMRTVYLLYEEFWMEGDERKKRGMDCIDMMERDLAYDLCNGQIGFFTFVLLKIYKTCSMILTEATDLEEGAKRNLKLWKLEMKRQQDEVEAEKLRKRTAEMNKREELVKASRGGRRARSSSEED